MLDHPNNTFLTKLTLCSFFNLFYLSYLSLLQSPSLSCLSLLQSLCLSCLLVFINLSVYPGLLINLVHQKTFSETTKDHHASKEKKTKEWNADFHGFRYPCCELSTANPCIFL